MPTISITTIQGVLIKQIDPDEYDLTKSLGRAGFLEEIEEAIDDAREAEEGGPVDDKGLKPGYCGLCRAKEIELFGEVLRNPDERHEQAVKEAGCGHPAFYEFVADRETNTD